MGALGFSRVLPKKNASHLCGLSNAKRSCVCAGSRAGNSPAAKGEYQLDLCFILRGTVDLYDRTADRSTLKVAPLSEGGFFGERGAIRGQPRTTDAVDTADDTRFLIIPRHCLTSLMGNLVARRMDGDRTLPGARDLLAPGT